MLKEKSIISNHFCICFTSKIYKNSEKKTNNQIYSSYSKNSFRYELFCFPLLFCTAIGETEIEANLAIFMFSRTFYLMIIPYKLVLTTLKESWMKTFKTKRYKIYHQDLRK